jgi:segregation and condensation protein A
MGDDRDAGQTGRPVLVRLPEFEGPLDLLLQLVERDRLPVTELSLARVTDGYRRRVGELEAPAEEMSRFLVVASRLLLLKSRRLLPRPEPEGPDEAPDDLAAQLRLYARFKAAAVGLREREGRVCYARLAPPPPPEIAAAPVSLPLAALRRALERALRRLDSRLPEGDPVPRQRLRLADVVSSAERLLVLQGEVTLARLAGPCAGRQETVVAFLAALDLVRKRRARAAQDGLFGPITLYRPGAED